MATWRKGIMEQEKWGWGQGVQQRKKYEEVYLTLKTFENAVSKHTTVEAS